MGKTPPDPIIAELWAIRDAHAAQFNYDVSAIFDDIRARQKASGRKYYRYAARGLEEIDQKAAD